MNNRKCFMEVEREKSSSAALVEGGKKSSSGCVNERICRVCLLCSWVVWGESRRRGNNMSGEDGVVREGFKEPEEQVSYSSNPYSKGSHAEVISGETIWIYR